LFTRETENTQTVSPVNNRVQFLSFFLIFLSSSLLVIGIILWEDAVSNCHPVDRLADVRSEIKQLEAEEEQLRAYLLEHPQDRTGQEYTAIVGSQSRKRVDLKALADEIGASVLARFTSFRSMMVVRLRELSGS
jgi:hypothetical protein